MNKGLNRTNMGRSNMQYITGDTGYKRKELKTFTWLALCIWNKGKDRGGNQVVLCLVIIKLIH